MSNSGQYPAEHGGGSVGWTREEYLASPAMARRLHAHILDLEDECAELRENRHSYVCSQCGERYSDYEFTQVRGYDKALREARWDISTLQTERDAAIAAAQMPLRQALVWIASAENLIAARDCARHALDELDPEWGSTF